MKITGPEEGLIIRYDFLWKREDDRGQEYGTKERPCAVVLASKPSDDGSRRVVVCPITHTAPEDKTTAIEIPPKVAAYLKLDEQRSWIRTHEVNTFKWEDGRIPVGVVPADRDRGAFGSLPPKLHAQMRDSVMAQRDQHRLRVVKRDDEVGTNTDRQKESPDRRAEQLERLRFKATELGKATDKDKNGHSSK